MRLHYLEAVCSFFIVGLGQILKGESQRGVVFLLVFYLALPALAYVALIINAQLFLYVLGLAIISGIMLWIYNIGDALIK